MSTMEDDDFGEILSHNISCRLKASEHAALQPFVETFPDRYGRPSMSRAIRWLLTDPAVVELMNARITERTKRS